MPLTVQPAQSSTGTPYLRCLVNGHVSLADAEVFGDALKPGGPHHKALVLCIVANGTKYSAESRHYFPTTAPYFQALATVVTSVVVKAAINFITRVSRNSGNFRMFNDEAEAMRWLEAQKRS